MRSRAYGAILAVLLVPMLALSADPTIVGADKVEAGKLVRLKIENLPKDAGVSWDAEGLDYAELDDESTFYGTGLPGTYAVRVTVAYLDGKKVRVKSLKKSIVIGDGKQVDPPKPKPQPDPEPVTEVVPEAWFILLEESSERFRNPDAIPLFLETYWNSLAIKKGHWRIYDRDSPDATRQGYTRAAEKVISGSNGTLKLPLVMAYTPSGSLISARNLGADRDDLRQWVRKITGLSASTENLMRAPFQTIERTCVNGVCYP